MNGKMLFGACSGDIADARLFKDIGFDFIELGVGSAMQPDLSNSEWAPMRDRILAAPLPVRACNCFIPGKFRLTGPDADFAPALDYAETACRRADEIGCSRIVLGSGGARNVPCVFGPEATRGYDIEGGRDQFVEFCKLLSKRIESCAVTVVIEPLRPSESNIVNYVWQASQIVDEVASPRIRCLADFYHMMRGREEAESIVKAGPRLLHCHIATNTGRLYPGAYDDAELLPFFKALKLIGYTGGVSCECGWQRDGDDIPREKALGIAIDTLRKLEELA